MTLHLTGPALRFFETSRSLQPARQVNAVVRPQEGDARCHETIRARWLASAALRASSAARRSCPRVVDLHGGEKGEPANPPPTAPTCAAPESHRRADRGIRLDPEKANDRGELPHHLRARPTPKWGTSTERSPTSRKRSGSTPSSSPRTLAAGRWRPDRNGAATSPTLKKRDYDRAIADFDAGG